MIYQKLGVLHEANQINQLEYDFLKFSANHLEEHLQIESKNDFLNMLIIHVAMAISRQRKAEFVDPMDDFLVQQIEFSTFFKEAEHMWDAIKTTFQIPVELHSNERMYILLHICNLLENNRMGLAK